ncbi:MAG TPA: hypothetical protein VK217_10350 [Acidimicrobiales bacterium]|nr:hypothetical protein [Acidimicrobiales bacterium]
MQIHLHGADELVALATGVLSNGSDQLTCQRIAERLETLKILWSQEDIELVGNDEAVDADRAAKIHLAREPPAKLDRLELASKRLRKRAFDQTLEPALELLQSHVQTDYRAGELA